MLPIRQQLVAPRVGGPTPAAAAGGLPLRLGGQAGVPPRAVRLRVVPRHVGRRVVHLVCNG